MKELRGFKQALHEAKGFSRQMNPELSGPEATAMAVSPALQEVWGQLGSEIGGNARSTEEVFGVSYKEFLAEYNRRIDLANFALEKFKESK